MSIKERFKARAVLPLASALFLAAAGPGPAAGQAVDYAAVFGAKYAAAELFVKTNAWIPDALALDSGEACLALAVVFPEIIRYSALEDLIQVRALKVLYVQYGEKHANFSVGHFQMKPTFAEQVERDANRLLTPEERTAAGVPVFATEDSVTRRRDRVLRLDDPKWQARYLGLFMRIMDLKHRSTKFAGPVDRLRFYATAYNAGYTNSEKTIRRIMSAKNFHTKLFESETKYCYADIAAFFFARNKE